MIFECRSPWKWRVLAMKRCLSPLRLSASNLLANGTLRNACASPTRERIRPMRRDCHCCRSVEFPLRACVAFRHCALDLNTYKPPTRQEARGADASFKGLRATMRGDRGRLCESRRDSGPVDTRAILKAPHCALAAKLQSDSSVGRTPQSYLIQTGV